MPKGMTLRKRLFSRLVVTDSPTLADRLGRPLIGPCLIWTGAKDPLGYGRIGIGNRQDGVRFTHRVAYGLLTGSAPDSELDHLCRVPACASPAHLEPVDHLENIDRGDWQHHNQLLKAMTHCKRGHEFTPANTYIIKQTGSRQCRTCVRNRRHKT